MSRYTDKPSYLSEIEGSDVPHVPSGRYLGRLNGVELATTRFGEALKFHWFVANPADGSDFEITQMTSTATSGGSNAGRLIRALIGRGLAAREKLPTAGLVGQVAILDVSIDPDSGWNRVEDVFPAPPPTAQPMRGRDGDDDDAGLLPLPI